MAHRLAAAAGRPSDGPPVGRELYGLLFHELTRKEALARVAQRDPGEPFAYVITPNVDHVVRLHQSSGELRRCYREAWLSLCDSAVLSFLAVTARVRLPVVAGSDLVEALCARLAPSDRPLVIGCEATVIDALKRRYGLRDIAHYNPPMGFVDDPAELQACIDFVVAHPARFVFLAVGSPQQEILANRLLHCGPVRGLGLCVGSSLRFLAGAERRAPQVLRGSGFEWLFRLIQDPRRLWRRYLVRGPIIFWIAARGAFAARMSERDGSSPPDRQARHH